jgi:hypothetical protein
MKDRNPRRTSVHPHAIPSLAMSFPSKFAIMTDQQSIFKVNMVRFMPPSPCNALPNSLTHSLVVCPIGKGSSSSTLEVTSTSHSSSDVPVGAYRGAKLDKQGACSPSMPHYVLLDKT